MTDPINGIRDPDLRHVEAALRRAAARARELGAQTKTPVFILREGKIIDLTAEAERIAAEQAAAKPDAPMIININPAAAAADER
jgi:hypothetical protein